jgi:hypothetical protein
VAAEARADSPRNPGQNILHFVLHNVHRESSTNPRLVDLQILHAQWTMWKTFGGRRITDEWAFAAVGPSRRPPDLCLFDLGSPGGVYSSRQTPSVAQGCRLLRAREVSWTFKNFQVNLENIDISDLHEKSRFVRTTEPQIGMGSRAQVSLAPPFVHCRPLRRPTRLSRRCWPSAPIRG